MNSMTQSLTGRKGCACSRTFVVFAFLMLPQPLAASEAQPAAAKATEPSTPAAAEPEAAAAASAAKAAAPSEEYKATKKIPAKPLREVLGCWQLDGQERWIISRLDASGAQVVTKLQKGTVHPPFPDRVRRAAVPSTLMYDVRHGNFGFATVGRFRPTLVVFSQSGFTLVASLYSKRSNRDRYAPTGNTATLQRCKAPGRTGTSDARPSTAPPRFK
jgi:hypothetical protein